MTDEAANFAAWLLGLLPRLALWPGGIALALTWGGTWLARRSSAPVTEAPPALIRLGLALAWVAVALLPLPGAAPLPLAPDALVLVGLLLAAGTLAGLRPGASLGLCAGAVAALAAGAGSLALPFASVPLPVALLAALAYAWGLAALTDAPRPPSAALRLLLWLGWLGLGWLIPAPGNLLTVGSVFVLILALIGRPQPAHLARRTAWLGGLALAGAVGAVLLA